MGRCVICNYEVQVKNGERTTIFGAMKYVEAVEQGLEYAREVLSDTIFIWPQTTRSKNKIWRKYGNCDYLQITVHANGHDFRKYKIEGKSV